MSRSFAIWAKVSWVSRSIATFTRSSVSVGIFQCSFAYVGEVMPLTQLTQDDSCVKRKIEALLNELKTVYRIKQVEIAERLGVTEGTIARQKDPEIGASTQMLASLELLKKVLAVERMPMGQLEQIEARLAALERRCPEKYPPYDNKVNSLNETSVGGVSKKVGGIALSSQELAGAISEGQDQERPPLPTIPAPNGNKPAPSPDAPKDSGQPHNALDKARNK